MWWTTAKPSATGSLGNKANNKHNQGKRDDVAGAGDPSKNIEIRSTGTKLENLSKSKKWDFAKANSSKTDFLTLEVKKAFAHLRKAFTEASILHHFDPEHYIRIETDAFGYAIGGIFSQLTPDQQSFNHVTLENSDPKFSKFENRQWHLVTFFSQKIISAKTYYKIHNQELLAIIETFNTWRYYLKGYKYEIFVLIDYNNLY